MREVRYEHPGVLRPANRVQPTTTRFQLAMTDRPPFRRRSADDAAANDGSLAKRRLAARARDRAVEIAARHHRVTDFVRRAIDLAQGKAAGPDDVG